MTALRLASAISFVSFVTLVTLAAASAAINIGCEKKADAAQGRDLYLSTCARCHGADGTGGLPLFDGGAGPRNFHEHTFQSERTDEQLKVTIVNGKGTGMPSFGTIFDEQQLRSLVAHLRSFDSERTAK